MMPHARTLHDLTDLRRHDLLRRAAQQRLADSAAHPHASPSIPRYRLFRQMVGRLAGRRLPTVARPRLAQST